MKNSRKYNTIAALLAGGSGKRMNSILPKQFLKIGSETIIQKCIRSFWDSGAVDKVIVVIPFEDFAENAAKLNSYGFSDFINIIKGGKTRQQSSYNAVKYIYKNGGCNILLIHDVARPFVSSGMILDSISAAQKHGAAEVGVPCNDTLAKIEGNFIEKIINRDNIIQVQTPQTFKFSLILKAHETAFKSGYKNSTDDAQLVLRMGKKVSLVPGSRENMKITNPRDLEIAKALAKNKL